MTIRDLELTILKYYEKWGRKPDKIKINPADLDEFLNEGIPPRRNQITGPNSISVCIGGVPVFRDRHISKEMAMMVDDRGNNVETDILVDLCKEKDLLKTKLPEPNIPTYWNF